ncbi:MAG: fibronectin type III domain-containing protein [Acidimicrobiales bacterium]
MVEVTSPGGSQPTWSSIGTQEDQVPDGAQLDLEIGTGGEHSSSFVLPVLPDSDQPVTDSDPRLQRQVRCGALRAQPCRSTPHQMETPDVQPAAGAIEVSWRSPQSWMGVNARVAPTDDDGHGDGSALGVVIKEHEPYSFANDPSFVFSAPGTAVPAAQGREYTATLRAKAAPESTLTGATIGALSFFDRDGVYVAGQSPPLVTMSAPDEDGWVTGTSTASAPPGAVLMVVGASFVGEVGDRFYVDDASIVDAWDWTGTEQLTASQRSPGAVSAADQVEAIEVRVSPAGHLGDRASHQVTEVAADETSLRVEGLDDGTEYQVQVRAKGPGGWGTPSPWSVPVTPRANLLGAMASIVESEPWGWGGYGTTVSRTTTGPRSGAGALSITVDDPEGAFLQSSMGARGRVP